jgi:hypothetical protein
LFSNTSDFQIIVLGRRWSRLRSTPRIRLALRLFQQQGQQVFPIHPIINLNIILLIAAFGSIILTLWQLSLQSFRAEDARSHSGIEVENRFRFGRKLEGCVVAVVFQDLCELHPDCVSGDVFDRGTLPRFQRSQPPEARRHLPPQRKPRLKAPRWPLNRHQTAVARQRHIASTEYPLQPVHVRGTLTAIDFDRAIHLHLGSQPSTCLQQVASHLTELGCGPELHHCVESALRAQVLGDLVQHVDEELAGCNVIGFVDVLTKTWMFLATRLALDLVADIVLSSDLCISE